MKLIRENNRTTLQMGRLVVEASRWPGQGYGWFPHKNGKGPKGLMNSQGARFGAGWNYRLGVDVGGRTVMVNLLFGMVAFSLKQKLP